MKDYIKNNFKVISILVIVILIAAIGITFAYTMNAINVTIGTGEYGVVYSGSQTLNVSSVELEPILDSTITDGSNSSKVLKINFGVKGVSSNPTDVPIIYDVSLTELDIPVELRNKYFKWRLYKNGSMLSEGNFSYDFDSIVDNRMVLTNIQQDLPSYSEEEDSYTFYIWISESCTGTIETCSEFYDQSDMLNKTFSGNIGIELSTKGKKELVRPKNSAYATLLNLNLVNSLQTDTPDFSKTSCSSGCEEATVGIYSMEDDLGTSYYFRGDVENNYVYFANRYWRIIRINGDGTVRMIYDGKNKHLNGEDSADRYVVEKKFNSSYTDNAYVGYMYGTLGASTYTDTHSNTIDSTIKAYLEDVWYKNFLDDDKEKIVDAIYCNDRSLGSGTGIGVTVTDYAVKQRLYDINPQPKLTCENKNDRFTYNESVGGVEGNDKLEAPIGLITADEVVLAGGVSNKTNMKFYLHGGLHYLTMSPGAFFYEDLIFYENQAGVFVVGSGGMIYGMHLTSETSYVRPVISLSSGSLKYSSTSDGSIDYPFYVVG